MIKQSMKRTPPSTPALYELTRATEYKSSYSSTSTVQATIGATRDCTKAIPPMGGKIKDPQLESVRSAFVHKLLKLLRFFSPASQQNLYFLKD